MRLRMEYLEYMKKAEATYFKPLFQPLYCWRK